MTIRQAADILYRYIVLGNSMQKIADDLGINLSDVSREVEDANFNRDRGTRNNFQGGQDKGRYGYGRAAARGVRITREMILEYLEYIDDYNYDFDEYIAEIAEVRYEEEQEARMREEERREREERARRQAALDAQRRQEQARREEQYRREQAARAEAERKRIEAENARRRAEQEALLKKYPGYIDLARKNLREGKLQAALDAVINARRCQHTYETNALIAEIQSKANNAAEHADEIIRELTQLEEWRKQNKKTLTPDENLWLARAYLNKGKKSDSCTYYFYAGDYYYDKEDYIRADAIYTEGVEKTGYFSNWSKNGAFRVAFSHAKKSNLTKEDYKYCVEWYGTAIYYNQQKSYAYGNRSWHNRMLGNTDEAVDDAKEAIRLGLHEAYVYNNLLRAQVENWDYDDLFETLSAMDERGYAYEPWVKGMAIYYSSDYEDEEALPYFKKQIATNPNHKESLRYLLIYEEEHRLAAEYAIRYLKIINNSDSEYSFICDVALNRADLSKDVALISEALKFNPEEKEKREAEKRENEERKRRIEAERKRLEEERIRMEEERRRAEEERRREEERLRALEEAKKKEREEKQRAEDEMLLSILF